MALSEALIQHLRDVFGVTREEVALAEELATATDTATSGVDNLVAQKGAANGLATLDNTGRIPSSQLAVDVMEYKGSWNALTNSPTLTAGVGDIGDLYRVSVAGTQDLGNGSVSFDVGDTVVYNGSTWDHYRNPDAAQFPPSPTRNLWVGTPVYPTVASAIAAAELLSGSAETDEQGVTVHVPTGFWNETITIKRNVHLVGDGQSSTRIQSVTYRPTDTALAPRSVRMIGIEVINLTIDNETASGSGIFNREFLLNPLGTSTSSVEGLLVHNCSIQNWNINNCFRLAFEDCTLGHNGSVDLVSKNVDSLDVRNCSFLSDAIQTMDSTDPNCATIDLMTPTLSGTFFVYDSSTFRAVEVDTAVGSDPINYRAVL